MANNLAQIKRARELLNTVRHAAMATVNEDGSPHNTPFRFLYDAKLTKIFWGSHPNSQHSKNILRTGQLFVVLYDAFESGGLYIKAEKGHPLEGKELEEALRIHNEFRSRENKAVIEINYYSGNSLQKMWSAKITNLWVNSEERGHDGRRKKDIRIEVKAEDIIN